MWKIYQCIFVTSIAIYVVIIPAYSVALYTLHIHNKLSICIYILYMHLRPIRILKNEMERNSNPAKLGKLMTLSDLSKR